MRGFLGGPRYKLDSALTHTISERLQVEKEAGTEFGNKVAFNMSCGFDGCSSHSKYMMNQDMSSQLLGVYTVTDLWDVPESGPKKLIWDCRDFGHNSIWNCRPFCVVPEEETRKVLKALMKGVDGVFGFDEEWKIIMQDGLTFVLPDDAGTEIRAILKKKPTPTGDGKMKCLLSGLAGAYCTLCTHTAADCRTHALIAIGFPINRTQEEIDAVCRRLANSEGHIPKSKRRTGDYPERLGVTDESISDLDWIRQIPVMHAPIHVMEWLCELLYRIMAYDKGVKHWVCPFIPGPKETREYTKEQHKELDAAKQAVKDAAYDRLRITIFDPAKMSTGNMFKMFKHDKSRELMSELITDDDEEEQKRKRDAWESIHLQLCAVTIVMRSQRSEIEVDLYKEICTDVYLKIVEEFNWAQIPQSIHQVLAHAGQLMEENGDMGLGWKEESRVEGSHGQHKHFLLKGGRKTNPYDCMKDSLNKMCNATSPRMTPFHRQIGPRRKATRKEGKGKLWDLVNSLFKSGRAPAIDFDDF